MCFLVKESCFFSLIHCHGQEHLLSLGKSLMTPEYISSLGDHQSWKDLYRMLLMRNMFKQVCRLFCLCTFMTRILLTYLTLEAAIRKASLSPECSAEQAFKTLQEVASPGTWIRGTSPKKIKSYAPPTQRHWEMVECVLN